HFWRCSGENKIRIWNGEPASRFVLQAGGPTLRLCRVACGHDQMRLGRDAQGHLQSKQFGLFEELGRKNRTKKGRQIARRLGNEAERAIRTERRKSFEQ